LIDEKPADSSNNIKDTHADAGIKKQAKARRSQDEVVFR
jgi:hypothetical protein